MTQKRDSGKMVVERLTIRRNQAMSHYKHLTINEREKLLILKEKGGNLKEIAQALNRSIATISREIKRNKNQKTGQYSACLAQSKYEKRRKSCRRKKLLSEPQLQETVRQLLMQQQWSPEQISLRLKQEKAVLISYTTIYRALHCGMMELTKIHKRPNRKYPLEKHLRRKGRKKKPKIENRGKVAISHSIEERPDEADKRIQPGHWEADCIEGKKGESCIVTLVERSTRYLICGKAEKHNAEEVTKTLIKLLQTIPKEMRQTVTVDRGKEFSFHAQISEKCDGLPFYFAHSAAPWEKGTIENMNGLLRQYFPKYCSLDPYNEEDVQQASKKLNLRPRKCLNWFSPFECLFSTSLHLT